MQREWSWYDRIVFLLAVVVLAGIMGYLWAGLNDKLDRVIDGQEACERQEPAPAMMYAYDDVSGSWTRVRADGLERSVRITDVLCRWAEWMNAKPGDAGLGPMLAKVCR
jgi:hypothetical protein